MATGVAVMAARKVSQNYWAILVAGVANFVFEAIWYTVFLDTWINGIGRTRAWLLGTGVNPYLQYVTALVMACLVATAISCVTQLTGEQTALRGVKVGALLWAGFVLTVLSTEYVFEVRPWSLVGVNCGFWLLGMMMMGAIVGAWRKKSSS